MAGAAVQDGAEHAGRVRPRHAHPLHRAGRRDQAGGLAVRQERVVGDRRKRVPQRPAGAYGTGAVTVNGRPAGAAWRPGLGRLVCCRTMRTSSTANLPAVHLSTGVSCVAGSRRAQAETPPSSVRYAGRMGGFLSWWDGVELWLSGSGVRRPDRGGDARGARARLRGRRPARRSLGTGFGCCGGFATKTRTPSDAACRGHGSRWYW